MVREIVLCWTLTQTIHTAATEIGVFYGSSMKMWREYFPNAVIYGFDLFNGALGNGMQFGNADAFLKAQRGPDALDRIELIVGDQGVRRDLIKFAAQHVAGSFDIILDDGGHQMKEQQETLATLFHLVRPGGYFIVEDVHSSWQGGRDVDADGSNSFLLLAQRYLKSRVVVSQYMSEGEREFLEREIGSMQLIYTNNNGSAFVIMRRAVTVAFASSSRTRTCNALHARSHSADRDVVMAVTYANKPRFDECARQNSLWANSWGAEVENS